MWWARYQISRFGVYCHHTLRMAHFGRWWDRLRSCPHRFNYDVKLNVKVDDLVQMKVDHTTLLDITLDGHQPMEWLDENARQRVHAVISLREDVMAAAFYHTKLYAGTVLDMPATLSLGFSDKKLALQWKLVWGGKMVDGRGVRLSLS